MINFDESDQASIVGAVFGLHLQKHGGKPDPTCEFCKGFILTEPLQTDFPLESYSYLILDVSDNGK